MSEGSSGGDEGRSQDAHWVDRAVAGDQQAYRTLFERYRELAYRLAYRFLSNSEDAADATQEAFIKAFRSLERFERRAKFSTWLTRIVTNTCLDKLRSRSSEGTVSLSDEMANVMPEESQPEHRASRPDERLEYEELQEALAEALGKLSVDHRTVFVLHTERGLTYREIAEVLGISEGTVMSRLYHARKNLQRLLDGAGVLPRMRGGGDGN